MTWDQIEGQSKQGRGKDVQQWGKMMNDDLAAIAGKYEELVGRLQEKHGTAKEEAKRQVELFNSTVEELKGSNNKLFEMTLALSKQVKESRKQNGVQSVGKNIHLSETNGKVSAGKV